MAGIELTYESVKVRPVLVPLRRPIVSKVGEYQEWPLILIDLHTREGVTGRSYLQPYLRQAVRYVVPAIEDLAAARAGKPVRPVDDFDTGRRSLNLVGYEGVSMIAVSGLDMAAWDALAKAAGLPLAELLGGSVGPVAAYNSNGLWLHGPGGLDTEAGELLAEGGFSAVKLRLGYDRPADDLHAIDAVRKAAGDDIRIMVDFNQGLSPGDAPQWLHALDDQGLYWFEEPIRYTELAGHALLARELRTPIQLGENFYGPEALAAAVAQRSCDYVMPDLMRIGGVTGWLRSAPVAAAAGMPVSSHLYPEVSAHLLRVTQTAHWLEWADWANPVLAKPFPVADGLLHILRTPGSGIEWNEAAVTRFTLDS
jgi:mandelate racemase